MQNTPTYKVYRRGELLAGGLTPNGAAHLIAGRFNKDLAHAHGYVRAARVDLAASIGRTGTVARES